MDISNQDYLLQKNPRLKYYGHKKVSCKDIELRINKSVWQELSSFTIKNSRCIEKEKEQKILTIYNILNLSSLQPKVVDILLIKLEIEMVFKI